MFSRSSKLVHLFFLILFALSGLQVSAHDNILSVNAGEDKIVNAGDTVTLTSVIVFEQDDGHKHKKAKKHKKLKKLKKHKKHHKHAKHAKHKKHKKHKKHRRHHDSDSDDHSSDNSSDNSSDHSSDGSSDDDNRTPIIAWTQSAGPSVDLNNSDTLTPSFVAPTTGNASEVLEFTLTVSDAGGNFIASDSVKVSVLSVVSTATISGRITTADGTEISGVAVDVLAAGVLLNSATSAANGAFRIKLAADSHVVLLLSANGYADQVVPAKSPAADGSVFIEITMIARGAPQVINIDAGASAAGADGASVSVAAGSFVDANGNPVSGDIDLTITPVDVSRPASLAAFPGEFLGVLEGATETSPIISFGTVEFEFSQNGQALQLAAGQTASVLIPIYIATYQDGEAIEIGDEIPLWSLNEDTGIWEQEGVGTVVASDDSPTGLAMQATVSHFSWWNCDVSMNAAQAVVTAFGPDAGTALIKARTSASTGWRPNTVETVSAVGIATPPMYIPSNGEVCFWADINFDNGASGSTAETCVNAAPNSLITVDLLSPVDGPVVIVTTPPATAGAVNVLGFLGFPINKVKLNPATFETAVSYNIVSGALPAGLSLNAVTAVSAEIAGVVTQTEPTSVLVEATDSDGNTDTVTINYSIAADAPAPDLEGPIGISFGNTPATFDLNEHNFGGPATSWTLSESIQSEAGPVPQGLSLNADTGILTILDACIFWRGNVDAANSNGSSQTLIDINSQGCS